jgi:hypothetical protein
MNDRWNTARRGEVLFRSALPEWFVEHERQVFLAIDQMEEDQLRGLSVVQVNGMAEDSRLERPQLVVKDMTREVIPGRLEGDTLVVYEVPVSGNPSLLGLRPSGASPLLDAVRLVRDVNRRSIELTYSVRPPFDAEMIKTQRDSDLREINAILDAVVDETRELTIALGSKASERIDARLERIEREHQLSEELD